MLRIPNRWSWSPRCARVLALLAGRAWGTVWVVLAVLAGQLLWVDQHYVDRRRDTDARRTDKPLAQGEISPRVVAVAAVVAGGGRAAIACFGHRFDGRHLVGIASTTAYNLGRVDPAQRRHLRRPPSPAFITLGLAAPHWPPAW